MDLPPEQPVTRRLDHAPIIAQAMQRLGLREVVDDVVPSHPRSVVTTGQCIEGLVTAIVMGVHTLYRVDEVLDPFDLELAFGYGAQVAASHFNDERLAKALDDLFAAGVLTVTSRILIAAVRAYELDLGRLHLDTTSVKVYGDYALSVEPEDPDDPQAIPYITHGFSKDRRPDLKQVVYGLVATSDGAVPIFGRTASGNRTDSEELRFTMTQLAKILPEPKHTVLVGDSKLFCGETLLLIARYQFDYVTTIPRSVELWEEAYAAFRADSGAKGPAPVLKAKERTWPRPPGHEESGQWAGFDLWRGRSYDMIYEYEGEHDAAESPGNSKNDKVVHHIPVRVLVVDSSSLRERKLPGIERRRERERVRLEKTRDEYAKRTYSCQDDAHKVVKRLEDRSWSFHHVEVSLASAEQRVKRTRRGRPPKGEQPKTETVWKIGIVFEEAEAAFAEVVAKAGCFVLATNLPSKGPRACRDDGVLNAYDEQHTVEGCMHWTKGPLAVAPIFLKTPERIAALGLVYVLALMVYALIKRQVRIRLDAEQTSMPGNKGWTKTPTTEVVFRLFEGVFTRRAPDLGSDVEVTNLNTQQVRILKLLGNDVLERPGVRVVTPREPRPGERAFKPRPRRRKASE